jgi:hypothetical protein
MTLGERSHGKVRPRQVRSSDLQRLAAAASGAERPVDRDSSGRFAPRNQAALGRGGKAAVRRLLGRSSNITDPEALAVARDADRLFLATLRELPGDGPTVRQLAALYARHVALASFWSARASAAGLGTDEGVTAQEHATKHGLRVERLAVTMLDVARATAAAAAAKAGPVDPLAAWMEPKT